MSFSDGDSLSRILGSVPWISLSTYGLCVYVIYCVGSLVWDYWYKSRSPLRELPLPKDRAGWLLGHITVMFSSENNGTQERWARELGETFAVRNLLGKYQLLTMDLRAVTHILFASHIYGKSTFTLKATRRVVGDGILVAEGDKHRDHRRILNPAFGFAQIRNLTGIFLDKSALLCAIWQDKCVANGGSVQLDAMNWLGKVTLDAIGKAGFDYEFGTLNEQGQTNELAEAFDNILRTDTPLIEQIRFMLNIRFPILRAVAPGRRDRIITESKKVMEKVGMRIVQEKKANILADMNGKDFEKHSVEGVDIISQLLRANLASNIDPQLRLSDQEVANQIPTFLSAAHDTTSATITWAMYALARNQDVQLKLRQELLDAPETPTLDILNALPYLDKVTREVLRLHTIVPSVDREAHSDDIIPLRTPIVGRDGKKVASISRLQVTVPIWLLNRSKAIWGEDADQFRWDDKSGPCLMLRLRSPDRWESPPFGAYEFPGITPNLMSFLGGPRSCIGFRFALAEIKALLFHIVRRFEWKLAVDPSELWSRTVVVMRPQLRGSNSIGLPVVITAIAQDVC